MRTTVRSRSPVLLTLTILCTSRLLASGRRRGQAVDEITAVVRANVAKHPDDAMLLNAEADIVVPTSSKAGVNLLRFLAGRLQHTDLVAQSQVL